MVVSAAPSLPAERSHLMCSWASGSRPAVLFVWFALSYYRPSCLLGSLSVDSSVNHQSCSFRCRRARKTPRQRAMKATKVSHRADKLQAGRNILPTVISLCTNAVRPFESFTLFWVKANHATSTFSNVGRAKTNDCPSRIIIHGKAVSTCG